jgi:hypothetical protein
MSGALASRLAALTVVDEDGHAVSLGRAWEREPAVLAFVRHFG